MAKKLDWEAANRRDAVNRAPNPEATTTRARWDGTCPWCNRPWHSGATIAKAQLGGGYTAWGHKTCVTGEPPATKRMSRRRLEQQPKKRSNNSGR